MRSRLRRASARSGRSVLVEDVGHGSATRDPLTNGIMVHYSRRAQTEPEVSFHVVVHTFSESTLSTEASPTRPPSRPVRKNLALLLLAMTQFVIVIDASIVNVALPSIGAHLHFARADLSWVVNAYTLTFGGFLLLGGRMADLLGRRRMFMLGLVAVLARLVRRRDRPVRGMADRRPRRPGPRRRDRLAGGAVDHHHHVRRGRRAQPRARDLGRGRRRRRRRRRAARRDPDQRPELALGAVRQRADRPRRRGDGAPDAGREPRRGRQPRRSTCPAR